MRIGFTVQKSEFLLYPADNQSFTPNSTYSLKINSDSFILAHYLLPEVSLAVRNKLHYHIKSSGCCFQHFFICMSSQMMVKRVLPICGGV